MLAFSFREFMPRAELLRRLSEEPVSSETCFVLLWTYLDQAHVAAGESHSRSQGTHHFRIEPHLPAGPNLRDRLAAAVQEMQAEDGDAFDLYALRWLKALDSLLNERQGARLGEDWITGLDGMQYRIRRRNHFLADSFEARVTSEEDQSGTRDLYTRFHVAVPQSVEGIVIDVKSAEEWAESSLLRRLSLQRSRLSIMLWPLQTILDYPALAPEPAPSDFVSLDEVRNEEELLAEVQTALAVAKEREACLLVFPELAIPVRIREEIRLTLQGHGAYGYPLMTLIGCCHCKAPEGGDLNEAILFGPDGTELHCHRKLTSFTFIVTRDRSRIISEQLRVGTTVTVLESPLGNLMPLICLDLIHMPLRQVIVRSHANLFAVPSLSPTTSPHQGAARDLQVDNRASSFVSNRALDGLTSEGTSFFRVPHEEGARHHLPEPQDSRFLLFSLEDLLDKAGK